MAQVIHIQKLTQRAAVAPAGRRKGKVLFLGFVEAADEGGQHVAVGGVVVIVGAVQVSGHDADIVGAVLTVEELAVFQAADLGQGVGFVGLFQLGGEQAAFLHGLGSHAGIDAGGTQEFQLLAAVFPGGMDDVHLQDHVVIHEIGQGFVVGHDAAHLGRRQKDVFRLSAAKNSSTASWRVRSSSLWVRVMMLV